MQIKNKIIVKFLTGVDFLAFYFTMEKKYVPLKVLSRKKFKIFFADD